MRAGVLHGKDLKPSRQLHSNLPQCVTDEQRRYCSRIFLQPTSCPCCFYSSYYSICCSRSVISFSHHVSSLIYVSVTMTRSVYIITLSFSFFLNNCIKGRRRGSCLSHLTLNVVAPVVLINAVLAVVIVTVVVIHVYSQCCCQGRYHRYFYALLAAVSDVDAGYFCVMTLILFWLLFLLLQLLHQYIQGPYLCLLLVLPYMCMCKNVLYLFKNL